MGTGRGPAAGAVLRPPLRANIPRLLLLRLGAGESEVPRPRLGEGWRGRAAQRAGSPGVSAAVSYHKDSECNRTPRYVYFVA